MIHSRTRRLAALTFAVAITAVCLAACGSSSSTGSNSSSSSTAVASAGGGAATGAGTGTAANRSKLVACLKAHGVTLPARPPGSERGTPPASGSGSESGSGGSGSGASGRRPGGGFFFGGGAGGRFANNPKLRAAFQACGGGRGFGGPRRFGLNRAAVTKFVACVKQHGYDLPAPNFSGKGSVFPAGIQNNKKFEAAAKACASDLRPAGAPGGAGGSGAGGSGGSSTSGD